MKLKIDCDYRHTKFLRFCVYSRKYFIIIHDKRQFIDTSTNFRHRQIFVFEKQKKKKNCVANAKGEKIDKQRNSDPSMGREMPSGIFRFRSENLVTSECFFHYLFWFVFATSKRNHRERKTRKFIKLIGVCLTENSWLFVNDK